MPQLVKGGKYVFGWSKVRPESKIIIPPEALEEYGFKTGENVILMSGSRTSGGFGITSPRLLEGSTISGFLEELPQLSEFRMDEGTWIVHNKRIFSWLRMQEGYIVVPLKTLESYVVHPGNLLLSVKGSGLALSFIIKGPLYKLAKKHLEIDVF